MSRPNDLAGIRDTGGGWPLELPRSGDDPVSFAIDFLEPGIFREYDLRGTVSAVAPDRSDPLNEFVANRIGRAFGTYLRRREIAEVVVGHDSRSYSERLATAFVIGLLSTGLDVAFVGLATSPMVYFAQHHLGGIAGVAVTASHNPNGWSGFKLSELPSTTLGPAEIAEVHELARSRAFVTGTGSYREVPVLDAYVADIASRVAAERPLKIVIDGANSISGPVLARALEAAGHEVVPINLELDWTFPNHEPDPEAVAAREQIGRAVLEHGADLGLSADGDGDRLGVTDADGAIVWSDLVLALLAKDTLSRHPAQPVVFDVKCSRAVGDVVREAGGIPVMWKTGHSHIKAKAAEISAPLSGERSGHFFDAGDYYGFDDAVYAAGRFAQYVAAAGRPLSELVGELPAYHSTPTMHAHCADDAKYGVVERFRAHAEGAGAEIVDVNGVRAEFEDGWFLVRASSNLPALVIVVEATTPERLKALYDVVREGLGAMPEVDDAWVNDPY
jgi:phosphomannomutase/phosphoglucomutase